MTEHSGWTHNMESPAHPGEMVSEYLEFNEWNQRDLARRTGLTPKTISEICNGKAPITPTTALALEKVFRRPAHFWLNLQRRYDEAQARQQAIARTREWQPWAKRFPVAEMNELRSWAKRFPVAEMRRYHLLDTNPDTDPFHIDALLSFFGVASPESWRSVWEVSHAAYRQTRKFSTNVEAISAWTRAVELEVSEIATEPFDDRKLRSLIPELRRQTRAAPEVFMPKVEELCASAGVAVVWMPELPQTGISGCARWLGDRKALIGLTLRYKTDDQMWFTFFHEVGHILLHRKRHAFILDNADEDLRDRVVDPEMQKPEEEANRFAADTLIPPDALSKFLKVGIFTNEAIHAFADTLEIGPGIIIGRLQREGVLARHQGNRLKRIFNWAIRDQ
jgi:HTH-type transcriptional regulator/antitoxin HigA